MTTQTFSQEVAKFIPCDDVTRFDGIGWIRIRIRIDPELLPGSRTRKIQSWILILNKSSRICNTVYTVGKYFI